MESVLDRMERIDAKRKMADFNVKMQMPYEFKKKYATIRAREFVAECDRRGLNYHVSVGGLDSIALFLFLHSIHIDAPGITVSSLEDKSVQRMHRALGLERLKSARKEDGTLWKKPEILQEFGFPVLSKEIAAKIDILSHPTTKNATVRHAIMTGETGAYGGNQKNSRMKLSQKWLEKFGGYGNEDEGTDYDIPPFPVSAKCCYYLKEKPCDDWARHHNSVPFLGLMASEGGRRAKSLKMNGCNYFGASTIRSAPFAIFQRDDLLRLVRELDIQWRSGWKEEYRAKAIAAGVIRADFEMPDSIVPEIYGTIEEHDDGTLYTTKAQRTGCSMCGFGIHMEKRPHRFDLLKERNPKEWDYWMYRCCIDHQTGEQYGWARVLDYIGIEY